MKTTIRCRNPSGFTSKRFQVFELCKGFMLCSNPQVAIFKKTWILNFVLGAEFLQKGKKSLKRLLENPKTGFLHLVVIFTMEKKSQDCFHYAVSVVLLLIFSLTLWGTRWTNKSRLPGISFKVKLYVEIPWKVSSEVPYRKPNSQVFKRKEKMKEKCLKFGISWKLTIFKVNSRI